MNVESLDEKIVQEQLSFYGSGGAGCRFAQLVAGDPELYRWKHVVVRRLEVLKIDSQVDAVIKDLEINQLSLLFPQINTQAQLEHMFNTLTGSSIFFFGPEIKYNGYRCVSLRAMVLNDFSWVSGLGPFKFLPETRQSPCTELVFRVKPKQKYIKSVQPPTPEGELHVANLELPNTGRDNFTRLWAGSFLHTREVLGHKPDLLSAAKTTFAIPV